MGAEISAGQSYLVPGEKALEALLFFAKVGLERLVTSSYRKISRDRLMSFFDSRISRLQSRAMLSLSCFSMSETESKLSSDLSLNFSLAGGLAWIVWNELRSMFLAAHWE